MTGKHAGHASVRANDGGTPLREDEITIASVLRNLIMPRAALVSGGAEVEVRLAFLRNMDLRFFTVIMIRFMRIHFTLLIL